MANSLVSAAKRKIRGSGSSSSDSDVSSPEGKKICNLTTSDSISSETSTDKLPTTQNMEKIILNRLDSVETKLMKLEGLFERLENVETAVSKNRVDLNNVNEKTKAIQKIPFKYKLGLIKTLIDRAYKINNTTQGFQNDIKNLSVILKRNLFPSWLIDKSVKGYLRKVKTTEQDFDTSTFDASKCHFYKLPYIGGKFLKKL